jgi:hypothetical protein
VSSGALLDLLGRGLCLLRHHPGLRDLALDLALLPLELRDLAALLGRDGRDAALLRGTLDDGRLRARDVQVLGALRGARLQVLRVAVLVVAGARGVQLVAGAPAVGAAIAGGGYKIIIIIKNK